MRKLYHAEHFHSKVLTRLAAIERRGELRKLLLELSSEEEKHARSWMEVSGKIEKLSGGNGGIRADFLLLIRRIFGLELAIKIMEYREGLLKKRLVERGVHRKSVQAILKDEAKLEEKLESKILSYSPVLSNIRDVVFGMNDGLVEILAAVAGIGAALQQPLLIIVAGLIVAISGTLSMAGGAYLSTEYGNVINEKKDEVYKNTSPKMSAAYVGFSYILGAIFPLLPFIFGATGYVAIGLSILVTAIVLTIVSSIISVVSDTPVLERIAKTLLITLGISAITIMLGIYTRTYLHLSI